MTRGISPYLVGELFDDVRSGLAGVMGGPDIDLTFATWTYGFDPLTGSAEDVRMLDLVTPEGIGLGSTRADIETTYGDLASVSDATPSIATILIIGEESGPHLQGRLEDDRLVLLECRPTCSV